MDFASLFASLLFGSIGLASWQIGRRQQSARRMVLGLALMGYTFLMPSGWVVWAVGVLLTVLAFLP